MVRVGIIGGTGFGSPDILKEVTRKKIHTPYGPPSDLVTLGKYEHIDIAIIPRHEPPLGARRHNGVEVRDRPCRQNRHLPALHQ